MRSSLKDCYIEEVCYSLSMNDKQEQVTRKICSCLDPGGFSSLNKGKLKFLLGLPEILQFTRMVCKDNMKTE